VSYIVLNVNRNFLVFIAPLKISGFYVLKKFMVSVIISNLYLAPGVPLYIALYYVYFSRIILVLF
jgi:hypothetical protein